MANCTNCGKELPVGATFCPSCGTPVGAPQGVATSPSVSGFDTLTKDSKAQDYWIRRIIAFVIDAILVYVVFYIIVGVLAFAIALPVFLAGGSFAPFAILFGTFALLGGVIFILYFTVMESSSGASFGKRIFGLKVVSKTGGNPTAGEAFLRNLSKFYWLLLLLDAIVGLAVAKGYQQKWSDHYLGTSVVPK